MDLVKQAVGLVAIAQREGTKASVGKAFLDAPCSELVITHKNLFVPEHTRIKQTCRPLRPLRHRARTKCHDRPVSMLINCQSSCTNVVRVTGSVSE